MIEQTEMLITGWDYHPPALPITDASRISSAISLDVMRKRASTKKGIACRFTCHFKIDGERVLECIGENSYVIDLEDVIDRQELLRMIRNAFTQFKEKFGFRKLGTLLSDKTMGPLNEAEINLDVILEMLV
ncbi:MAG: hypothetical protein KGO92_10410 [Bacteroidota bacterium]|nr:hypothetical protein [Bacteroidota bacterium]